MTTTSTCKKCTPVKHLHLDHSYQSFIDDDDAGNEIVVHIYSCKLCPCETRVEGGDLNAFRAKVFNETTVHM